MMIFDLFSILVLGGFLGLISLTLIAYGLLRLIALKPVKVRAAPNRRQHQGHRSR